MGNDNICPKCQGTGIVKEQNGTVHTCFDCLVAGRLDQHDKRMKSGKEIGIKI